MIRKLRRSLALSALVLAACCSTAAWAEAPAVLNQVPDQAAVVLVIKDLKGTMAKVSNLATRVNAPLPPDLLGMVKQRLGLAKGLDDAGSAAVFTMLPQGTADAPPPQFRQPFVLLLPTTDSKAMLESFKPTAPENGISEVMVPDENGTPGYVAKVGNYVAFAADRDFLQYYMENNKAPLAKKLAPDAVKSFEDNDLVVYANVSAFGPMAITQMDAVKPLIKGAMAARPAPGTTDAEIALQQLYVDWAFNGARQWLTDAQAAVLSVRIADSGVTLGLASQFKPDTDCAKLIAGVHPLPDTSLTGLPAGSFLAAGSVMWDKSLIHVMMDSMFEGMTKSPLIIPEGAPGDEMRQSIDLMHQSMDMVKAMKIAIYEPKGEQKGLYHGTMVVDVTDSDKYRDLQRDVMKHYGALTSSMNPVVKAEFIPDASPTEIKGISVYKGTLKMALDPDRAQSAQGVMTQKLFDVMYGGDHFDMAYASVTKTRAIMSFGLDPDQLEAAVAAATGETDLLAPQVGSAGKVAVANPVAVGYIAVDKCINVAKTIMGVPVPPADPTVVQAHVDPVTVSSGITGNDLVWETHLPVSLLSSITQMIKESMGMPAGAPAGVPPAP